MYRHKYIYDFDHDFTQEIESMKKELAPIKKVVKEPVDKLKERLAAVDLNYPYRLLAIQVDILKYQIEFFRFDSMSPKYQEIRRRFKSIDKKETSKILNLQRDIIQFQGIVVGDRNSDILKTIDLSLKSFDLNKKENITSIVSYYHFYEDFLLTSFRRSQQLHFGTVPPKNVHKSSFSLSSFSLLSFYRKNSSHHNHHHHHNNNHHHHHNHHQNDNNNNNSNDNNIANININNNNSNNNTGHTHVHTPRPSLSRLKSTTSLFKSKIFK